jgi:hypothetical protein
MLMWEHDVHPFESHMILHQVPEVSVEMFDGGWIPVYGLEEDCEHWVVEKGRALVAVVENATRIVVPFDAQTTKTEVVELLTQAGCSMIRVIEVNGKYRGGLGLRVLKSHLNCRSCMVRAVLML